MRATVHPLLLSLLALSIPLMPISAQDLFGEAEDTFTLEEPGSESHDFDLLGESYLTEIATWPGVVGAKEEAAEGWKVVIEPGYDHLKSFVGRTRLTVRPLSEATLESRVDVPEAASYRVWLCYLAGIGQGHPLHVEIGDAKLTYHERGLSSHESGTDQEKSRPIRFESDIARLAPPRQPTLIWEYRDVELAAGRQPLRLRAKPGTVRVDALMITRSRDFRPSKALPLPDNTLGRTYLRFRVVEAEEAGEISFANNLTYHSPHALHGDTTDYWYWAIERELDRSPHFGGEEDTPVKLGEWSRWLDGSASLLSRGSFVTCHLTIKGAGGSMRVEAQLAWYPHESAVAKTLEAPVAAGASRATLLLPLYLPRIPLVELSDDETIAWGMRDPGYLAAMRNSLDVVAEQQAVLAKLELPDAPKANALVLTTSANPDPAAATATAEMLRTMGLSHAWGLSATQLAAQGMRQETFTAHNDLLFHSGTHCPIDPLSRRNLRTHFERTVEQLRSRGWEPEQVTKAKFGDEIGAIVSPVHINRCSDCLRRFHQYLGEHFGDASFFGAASWEDVRLSSEGESLFDRRLRYASGRFMADFTAEFYAVATEVIEELMPNCRTYCNFSPHPVIFGGTMNHADWFNLTRRGGTTLAWGEDWASMSNWGFYMGLQIVSYYASLVEAAARGSDGHGGFYAVWGNGHQQASCISRGLNTVVIYSYGPTYSLADAANSWSDRHDRYGPIARGLRALGAGDIFLAEGEREAAPVAILYNRDHEVWHESHGQLMQSERASLLVGLSQANVPTAIAIEEDLLGEPPEAWKAIYVNGFNLSDELVEGLRRFAEAGGTVVFTGGAGMYDRFNSRGRLTADLLGVSARLTGASEGNYSPSKLEAHSPFDTLHFDDGGSWPIVGLRFALTPTGDVPLETLATYDDGTPALVRRTLGKGLVYTWGVLPGVLFRAMSPMANGDGKLTYSQYRREDAERLALPVAPLAQARGHRYSNHLVETRQYDRPEGSAILLNNFAYRPLLEESLRLRWPANRPLGSLRAVHAGDLTFTREGDWIVAPLPLHHEIDLVLALEEAP